MCDAIAGFLDYSSSLVEKEGNQKHSNKTISHTKYSLTAKVISDAVTSLLAKLPEEEKVKVNKAQVTNEMKDKLQEKIAVIVEPAFSG